MLTRIKIMYPLADISNKCRNKNKNLHKKKPDVHLLYYMRKPIEYDICNAVLTRNSLRRHLFSKKCRPSS